MSINTVFSSTVKKQLFNRKEPDLKDGLFLRIHHTPQEYEDYRDEQILRFLHTTLNPAKNTLAISNIRGDIYMVNLSNNKYWMLYSFASCTALKFSPETDDDLLVGLSGGDISVLSTENARVKTNLRGHKDSVIGISFSNRNECLCFSKLDAILWNLKGYFKIYTICCKCDSAIKEIVFAPSTNYIVGYDQDDIISVWDSNNYNVLKQIVPTAWDKFNLKSLAFTRDGRIMVLAGSAPQIAVYSFNDWAIVKILILSEECKASEKIDFISQPFDGGANQLLAVLGTNGIVYIYNMDKDQLVTRVMSEAPTKRMELSSNGKILVNIISTGQIFVYSVDVIIRNITTRDSKELVSNEVRNIILLRKSSHTISEMKKEVLLSKDWLQLWDHILTNEPSFLLFVPVAYSSYHRNALLSLNEKDQFQQFFHRQNPIDMKHFIFKSYYLFDNISRKNHPRHYLREMGYIESFYPTFDQFPFHFNQNYSDDGLTHRGNKFHRTDENAAKLKNFENGALVDTQNSFQDATYRGDHFGSYLTLRREQLSKLQKELENEQGKLMDSRKKQMNETAGSALDAEQNIFLDNYLNLCNIKAKGSVDNGKNGTELKLAIDQLISTAYQQMEKIKSKTVPLRDGYLIISRLVAENKKIQNEIEQIMYLNGH